LRSLLRYVLSCPFFSIMGVMNIMGQVGVVVVAAGKGSRMGTAVSKQHLPLSGKPILVHTLEAFESMELVESVVLVIGAGDEARCGEYVRQYGLKKVSAILTGGAERQASVYQGLQALDPGIEWVLVHDGVRPFITEREAVLCLEAAQVHGAAVLAAPVKDTVKFVEPGGRIESTPDRSRLWAIQTPQAFRVAELLAAHELAVQEGFAGTDDAMLVEHAGQPVYVVEGSYANVKITTPEDLEWAEFRMKQGRGESCS
jgi:2-C-methyl-D-erythritol 4-phosphate cytidylyltransferase